MAAFIAGILVSIIGSLIFRSLLSLGVGFVAWTGIDNLIQGLTGAISSQWAGMGADLMGLLSLSGVDVAMTIILSAYVSSVTFMLSVGLTRMTFLNGK